MPTFAALPVITALYAGLLGLLSIAIAIQAGRARGQTGISIGDGANPEMIVAMRRHANFVEFVPLALVLIGLLEMKGVSATAIHARGGGLFFARVCHAIGFRVERANHPLRTVGALGSTLVMLAASIWSLVVFI
jgi:uncharacterized membrane protein YecN with MAPEG domain